MRSVCSTTAFCRDLKRAVKRGWDIKTLQDVVVLLQGKESLPVVLRSHGLGGEWKGFWECHVAPDWLLIYNVTDLEVVLARTGTHADLFR